MWIVRPKFPIWAPSSSYCGHASLKNLLHLMSTPSTHTILAELLHSCRRQIKSECGRVFIIRKPLVLWAIPCWIDLSLSSKPSQESNLLHSSRLHYIIFLLLFGQKSCGPLPLLLSPFKALVHMSDSCTPIAWNLIKKFSLSLDGCCKNLQV